MTNSLKNVSTAELQKSLRDDVASASGSIVAACAKLYELNERKVFDPHMQSGALKWFREIHTEKLDADFVLMFAGAPSLIRAAVGSSLKDQRIWAKGGEIRLAETNAAYEVVETSKPLHRMNSIDLKVAFNAGKPRPMKEQFNIVRKSLQPIAPVTSPKSERVRADVKDESFVIKGTKYRMGEFKEAAAALGYRLTRIPKSAKADS